MTDADRAWALTAALLGVHQGEEVAVSMTRWLERVGTTGWPRLDAHIRPNPLAGSDIRVRAGVVVGQAIVVWVGYRLTRSNRIATRWVTTVLVLGWAAAFLMHLTVSARTRSFMPGTATSVVPGIPGAVWVIRRIRQLTR